MFWTFIKRSAVSSPYWSSRQRCSVRKGGSLDILQNSQENTYSRVFFNKVAGLRLQSPLGDCLFSEAVAWRCSVKKIFLEISQNSQENTCARVSLLLKKTLWHRCFPVNFVKFLRTPFFTENLRWLLLSVLHMLWKHGLWWRLTSKMVYFKFQFGWPRKSKKHRNK